MIPLLSTKVLKGCDVHSKNSGEHMGFVIGRTTDAMTEVASGLSGPGKFNKEWVYVADNGKHLKFSLASRMIESVSEHLIPEIAKKAVE